MCVAWIDLRQVDLDRVQPDELEAGPSSFHL
jgi:hypothetical protein